MTAIIDERLRQWAEREDPLHARIRVFEKIRDIPYAVIPELNSIDKYQEILTLNKGSCTPKHFLLCDMYQRLGMTVLFVVYPFRWDEFEVYYPPHLKKLARQLPDAVSLYEVVLHSSADGFRQFRPLVEETANPQPKRLRVVQRLRVFQQLPQPLEAQRSHVELFAEEGFANLLELSDVRVAGREFMRDQSPQPPRRHEGAVDGAEAASEHGVGRRPKDRRLADHAAAGADDHVRSGRELSSVQDVASPQELAEAVGLQFRGLLAGPWKDDGCRDSAAFRSSCFRTSSLRSG